MTPVNHLSYYAFTSLPTTGTQSAWDLLAFIPNGALDPSHIEYRLQNTTGVITKDWTSVTGWTDDTGVATQLITFSTSLSEVHFRRNTPRYEVVLDPLVSTNRVSQNNLQVNADQALYTAVEWAAQYAIDAYARTPAPGTTPNTLALQQQTQNYFGPTADYTTHVWNFQFAGGYISRSHVKVMALVNDEWIDIVLDTDEALPQYGYDVRPEATDDIEGPFDLSEDGLIERREEGKYDNDPNPAPFRFIGDYQLYMDFSTLDALPTSMVIYRYTPRDVKVSSIYDGVVIDADGMEPSARHALFVAVELGEVLSQYAPECDCFIGALESLSWSFPDSSTHVSQDSVTLTGSADVTYTIDLFLTGNMEVRPYSDNVVILGGNGHFITADSNAAGGSTFNYYRITISDPPQTYYVNRMATENGESTHSKFLPDGSDEYKLTIRAKGNATVEFYANDYEGFSDYVPQYGTITAKVTGTE